MNTYNNSQRSFSSNCVNYLPAGIVATTACVGIRAFIGNNRSDTFVKTIKNCAKAYTHENKQNLGDFFEFINMKKFGDKIKNVGNKKMFAFIFAADTLFTAITFAAIKDFFKKKD